MAQQRILPTDRQNPYRLSSATPLRLLPAMRFEVCFDAIASAITVHKLGADTLFRIRDENPESKFVSRAKIDAYASRDAFLNIKNEAEALDLLLAVGGFRRRDEENDFEDRILWSDFKHWQTAIRSILSKGPLPANIWDYHEDFYWIDHYTDDASIRTWVQEPETLPMIASVHPFSMIIGPTAEAGDPLATRSLRAEFNCAGLLPGILATTFLDRLHGKTFRLCGLADCQTMYEVNSKHARQYCSQPCAHKASVRRRRAVVKEAQTSKPKKARKLTGRK